MTTHSGTDMGLDGVELVMDLEATFNASAAEGVTLTTVGALYDWVRRQAAPDAPQAYSGELWERYLDVVERSTGIPRRDLRPDAAFQDLGLN